MRGDEQRALLGVQQAVTQLRLYPPSHRFCVEALDRAQELLEDYLRWQGGLEVEVTRAGLTTGRGDEISVEFAELLYAEGIRSLALEEGLERSELLALVEVLAGQGAAEEGEERAGEHDLLSELWRRELTHVHFLVFDELAPARVHGGRALEGGLEPIAARIRELLGSLGGATAPGSSAGAGELEVFLARQGPPVDAGAEELGPFPERAASYLRSAAGAARRELVAVLEDDFLGDDTGRCADLVAWADQEEDYAPAPGDVLRFLEAQAVGALREGDLERAGAMLARIEASGAEGAGAALLRLGSSATLGLLLRAVERGREAFPAAVVLGRARAYLAHLPGEARRGLVGVYPLAAADLRELLRERIRSLPGDPSTLEPLIQHPDEEVAKLGFELLGGAGPEGPGWKVLERLASSEHPSAARARSFVEAKTGVAERRALLEIVLHGEAGPRLGAAARLRTKPELVDYDALAALIETPGFASRPPAEASALLEALTRAGGVRAVRLLETLADSKAGLLSRKGSGPLAEPAKRCLELLRKRGS